MKMLASLAWRSAWNRRLTLGLTVASIAVSVALLLGIERIRVAAKDSFAQSVSGTDLVVGARTSPVQLMLYSVFRIGEASNSIGWQSARMIASHPAVAWTIPLALGDSHAGFAVLGTTAEYFAHFRYGSGRPLVLADGKPFESIFEAVIGAEVAQRLGYRVGDAIALDHGGGALEHAGHEDKPFVVTGIFAGTGTPVDRTVHVSLEAIEAIHLDWAGGMKMPGVSIPPAFVRKFDLQPKQITAVLVGLKNRAASLQVQRQINDFTGEPLLAVMPAVALQQLWQVVGVVERSLLLVSAMVVAAGLIGLVAVVLAGLNERRRELAILRSVGAQPRDVFLMLVMEGAGITLLGALAGVLMLALLGIALGPWVAAQYGVAVGAAFIAPGELSILGLVTGVGLVASLAPGYRAYRLSLADGMTPRL